MPSPKKRKSVSEKTPHCVIQTKKFMKWTAEVTRRFSMRNRSTCLIVKLRLLTVLTPESKKRIALTSVKTAHCQLFSRKNRLKANCFALMTENIRSLFWRIVTKKENPAKCSVLCLKREKSNWKEKRDSDSLFHLKMKRIERLFPILLPETA